MSLHFLQLAWWLHRERVLEHIDDLPEHDRVYFEGFIRRAYLPEIAEARAELARVLDDEATHERELREALRLSGEMGADGHAERVARVLAA